MRVTKLRLTSEEDEAIEILTDKVTSANKDITLAYDFAKDIYALFKEDLNKRRILKSYWDIFKDVRDQYVIHKTMDLMKNVDFYGRVRTFFRFFISSRLFYELNKLDPIEALEVFLNLFKQQKEKEQEKEQDSQKDDQGKDKDNQQDQKEENQKQDQGGISADEDNLPINMGEFKEQIPKIEKILESGLLSSDDFQSFLGKEAGIGHSEFQIGNIIDLISKISKKVKDRDLEIFYVARKKEVTEQYHRDEVLESILYPEDEITVKNIDNPLELLKLIPTQYAYDDDIFMQKLVKKELLVKDYKSRRLKRQALYLLIDISGSMNETKNVYACGVALAFVRQAVDEGSTYFLRFFDDNPHQLFTIKTKQEAEKMIDILIRQPFSGSGTSIQSAIKKAVEDITNSPENFEKSEIMIISDGEDHVRLDKEELKNVKVHSTIINGRNNELKNISETYIELNSRDMI